MTGVPLNTRIALLQQYGSFTQAYSATFQPALEHFGDEDGFIAYKRVWGTALVLSDPIAPPQHYEELVGRFLAAEPDVAIWYASRHMAEFLAPRGFFINEMGPENWIDLGTYDFAGRDKRNVRQSLNRMHKCGYTIKEASISAVGAQEVNAVSESWRRVHTVYNREVAFISRPMVVEEELDVRTIFTFDQDGKVVAFAVFDPVYEQGKVVGYTSQHNRHRPDADSLVQHAIRRVAIEKFRAEGKKLLVLGLSPLAYIHDHDFAPNKNWLVRRTFRFAYENWLFNRLIYPLKPLSEHKRQFRGSTEQTYYCFNKLPSLPRILKLLRACNIV